MVGLYLLAHFGPESSRTVSWLRIPDLAFWFAGVSGLVSLGSLILHKQTIYHYFLALSNYLLITATCASLTVLTGGSDSPFIALWLLVAIFAALFGRPILLLVAIASNINVGWELFFSDALKSMEQTIKLLLLTEAPLVASYVIWHESHHPTTEKAYNALAEQLSQVANKSEIVINSIADGVIAIDGNGLVQLINPAAQNILGWSKKDALGLDYRSIIKLVDDKGNPISEELLPIRQVLLSNKPATNNNLGLVTKSGKTITLSLLVSPVTVGEHKAGGVIIVFRDITKEKEQERQRAEFISTASHEMRTPVAAIEGYLGLAMNPQTAVIDDKARTYLQKAYDSTKHLGGLFQDLLTVSRAEDGRLLIKPAVLDAISFAREVVESLEQKAKDKNISLVYAPGKTIDKKIQPAYFIYADPGQLREVLSNLVDNAIKYTMEGTVTIDVSGDSANVTIKITDTGIGIPPEDIPHLFQKFYRVDSSDTREIGGTGLGLFIARQLIEANGGHIIVDSVYGKGSTFMVSLPRMENQKAAAIIKQTPISQTPASQL